METKIKPAWSTPKSEDFDLREFAYGVLEIAKENLQRDGELIPIAFLITADQIQCVSVEFSDHDEKLEIYGELVKAARTANAIALVSVNDAFMSNEAGPETVESYYSGKLQAEKSPECIMLTVSGPGMKNWSVDVPYERTREGIQFQEMSEESGGEIGFLEGWATESGPKVQ